MAEVAVTNTFVTNTVISSSAVNQNYSDLVTWLNNRYNGVDTWSFVKVSSTDTNPVDIISSGATTEVSIDNTATDGDPVLSLNLSGVLAFRFFVDDSDSDKLKMAGSSNWVTINSSGEVGIGTENPESYNSNSRNLVIADSASNVGIALRSNTNAACIVAFQDAENTTVQGLIQYNHSATATSETLDIRVGGVDLYRLDGTGRMGVGTQNMSSFNTSADNLVVASGSGAVGVTIRCGSASTSILGFADAEGTTLQGLIQYNHNATAANETMVFRVGETDWINIDGNGNINQLGTTKTQDVGTSSQAFDDMFADDFQNVADIPFFDFVKDQQGNLIEVNDLEVIKRIKPLKDAQGNLIFNENGHAYWDDTTIPEWVFSRDSETGELMKDADGKPWVSMKVLCGLSIGALGQLIKRVERIKDDVDVLKTKVN